MMKNLNEIVLEKLKINKRLSKHTLFPETKEELQEMIVNEVKKNGNKCSLNHIDVSNITDMTSLFRYSYFDGDISEWDVSNVTNMYFMFSESHFTGKQGGLNKWDVSNVTDMSRMFEKSVFDADISKWDVSNVEDMRYMFYRSKFFNQDISSWNVSKVNDARYMFCRAEHFKQNLSSWKFNENIANNGIFEKSLLNRKRSWWPKIL